MATSSVMLPNDWYIMNLFHFQLQQSYWNIYLQLETKNWVSRNGLALSKERRGWFDRNMRWKGLKIFQQSMPTFDFAKNYNRDFSLDMWAFLCYDRVEPILFTSYLNWLASTGQCPRQLGYWSFENWHSLIVTCDKVNKISRCLACFHSQSFRSPAPFSLLIRLKILFVMISDIYEVALIPKIVISY